MIIGSMIGSAGATAVVKASQEALKSWPELDRKKKSEVLNKLKELKAKAKETLSADLSAAPAEKKTAAREKADAVDQQFKAAVKKQTEQGEGGGDENKAKKEEVKRLRAESKAFDEPLEKAREEWRKIGDELDDARKEERIADRRGDDAGARAAQKKQDEIMPRLEAATAKRDEIDAKKAALWKQISGLEDSMENESSSHKFTKHVMLFEQFINKLY